MIVITSMKQLFLGLITIVIVQQSSAQTTSLDVFNKQQQKIDKTAFTVLGSWAVANIATGSVGWARGEGSNKYFHQMNVLWNSVNLGLAVMGYLGTKKSIAPGYTNALKNQAKLEKTFLFNAGLDMVYITGGFYLRERAKNRIKNSDKFKGWGESLLLQGGGLLLFDAIMYTIHNKHGKQLYKLADKVQLTVSPANVGLLVKL